MAEKEAAACLLLAASPQEWLDISQMFSTRWNFPNCVGAIDGPTLRLPNDVSFQLCLHSFQPF